MREISAPSEMSQICRQRETASTRSGPTGMQTVRATHLFLSEHEIAKIKKYVPQALKEIPHLILAEDEGGHPVAFMGIEADKLEMQSVIDM